MTSYTPLPLALKDIQRKMVDLIYQARDQGFLVHEVRAHWTYGEALGLVDIRGEKTPADGR
jgi:hypothetical protein